MQVNLILIQHGSSRAPDLGTKQNKMSRLFCYEYWGLKTCGGGIVFSIEKPRNSRYEESVPLRIEIVVQNPLT